MSLKNESPARWHATDRKHGREDSDSRARATHAGLDLATSSRSYPNRQIRAERVHLHQQNPATATLAAFSSAMGRYSASRHPPPCYPHPASRASSVFRPYRCFRSTPSILPLTYPSSPTIVPFSHPFCLLPPTSSSVSTSSSFSSDHFYLPAAATTAASFTLGGLVHRCTS